MICVIGVICMIILNNTMKSPYFCWNASDLCHTHDLVIFYLLLRCNTCDMCDMCDLTTFGVRCNTCDICDMCDLV